MRYLFLFAHPDDETVAAGGTIRRLVDKGNEVIIVLATDGSAGKISKPMQRLLKKHKSISTLRKREFEKACNILGISKWEILDFPDGEITNKVVWGELTLKFAKCIDLYKPDVVVTFDHSGWYFHLDHVGISIAVTRAVDQTKHKVDLLLFSLFRPIGIEKKWKYIFSKRLLATHEVDINLAIKTKLAGLEAYESQEFSFIDHFRSGRMKKEYFQVAVATNRGRLILIESRVFKAIKFD